MTDARIIDKLGNNVAIECDNCHQAYIIGPLMFYRKPRVCPHCQLSQAIRNERNDRDGMTVTIGRVNDEA
jgi:hypothetical protein